MVDLAFFCDFIAGFVYWGQQFVFHYGTTICFPLSSPVVCKRVASYSNQSELAFPPGKKN
jgi:hypothetical protein